MQKECMYYTTLNTCMQHWFPNHYRTTDINITVVTKKENERHMYIPAKKTAPTQTNTDYKRNTEDRRAFYFTPYAWNWLGFNCIFSTMRLYRVLKYYTSVKRLISAREIKKLCFGECNNMCENWEPVAFLLRRKLNVKWLCTAEAYLMQFVGNT